MNSQSPAEALRQQIETIGSVAHIAWPDGYQWCVTIPTDKLMELVTAYAATVEREAELKGRIDEAEYWWSDVIPATNNAVIKRAEDRRRELYDRLAALQGPRDGDGE